MAENAPGIVAGLDRSPSVPEADALSDEALAFVNDAAAENTKRAYRSAWACFTAWCEAGGRVPMPASPATVGSYLAQLANGRDGAAGLRVATLRLRLAAIATAHRYAGHRLDTQAREIVGVMRGASRRLGTASARKDAATTDLIRDAVRTLAKRGDLPALRARALLLLGFAAALRRSELVALDVADLAFTGDGLTLRLRRRKTDQLGQGTEIGVPFGSAELTCPVAALRAWLAAAGIAEGPVFRSINRAGRVGAAALSAQVVALAVKEALTAAGHDASGFSGHSLRSGFATSAARAGVPEAAIQRQTGHKSLPVLRTYIRRGGLFVDNAAAKLGL